VILVRNIRQLATPRGRTGVRGAAMRALDVHEHAAIVIDDERFAYVGPERDMPRFEITEDVDARQATVIPGFVDSHTHIPFDGFRESEFNRRLQGETYEQVAASGGGIASSVRATRAASEEQLTRNVLERARMMARYGTTTSEAKSGYGLNLQDELKQLRAIRAAAVDSPVRLIPTCLAAHEFPPEGRAGWVERIIDEILPAVANE
jgi:imidazolonepropionase